VGPDRIDCFGTCAPEAEVSGGLTRRMVVAGGLLALLISAAFAVVLVG
jgi:hypothetical protein